ncbi:MAG TPA: class I SAM-dependent methyltransferase [Candidatus Limnocylindria bacterium]|nr:class I SAM-dependent methyltransferase [Candidatus Limnocylindria bacterium]
MANVGRTGCASALRPGDDVELRRVAVEPYLRGRDVLELGAGDGRLTWLIAPLARSVVAIDPDRAAIAKARRAAGERGATNVTFRVGPAQAPRVGAGRFDTALFSWSL